mmetsp:Transcript_21370/g.63740  ORF Transcript_21370/g.63740 Transcript_21370/m.63740 type:complete len:239 (-) Transcript_21370:319-1035(-)
MERTDETIRVPGPDTRAATAEATMPRVAARELHSESGGASLILERHPPHMRERMSATLRWPAAEPARSDELIACTLQSRRRRRICRRTLYSCRSVTAASRTPISCIRDHLPPRSAGPWAPHEAVGGGCKTTASATADSLAPSFPGESLTSAAVPSSLTRASASPMLAELSTADAMPSRLPSGLSAQPLPASAGPARAGKSKPRPAATRAPMRSEETSRRSERRQAPTDAGASRPSGRT